MNELDHAEMVGRIIAVYGRASEAQAQEGRRWYPTAHKIVSAIADETRTDPARVGYALAALSPRNPWLWNIADCYHFAVAKRTGQPMPSATTFGRNQRAAWAALDSGTMPWVSAAPKVTAFVKAINGVVDAVVVDVWAYRVATGQTPKNAVRNAAYAAVAAAYIDAADIVGESPTSLQAITWIVAQNEGLASARKGRHDLTFKAGTPDFVRDLLTN